jgi:Domain of unknown function (DUF4278)
MQLSYRGVNYQTSAIKLPNIVNLIVAKYRGADYTIPQRNISINKPNTELKYRGVSYQPTATYPTNKIQPAFQLN